MATSFSSDFPTHPQDSTAPQPRFGLADFAALTLLTGCLIAIFWKVIFTSSMLYYRDIYNYTYPAALFVRENCRQGVLPYWNPYLNYGQPLLANPNLLFFYPYTLFIILLPLDIAYPFHYIVHFAIAGAGTYLLARRWRQSRLAAFFAAFVFTFSGPVLSLGNLYNEVACTAWVPWVLLMTDRVLERRGIRDWILLVLVFALQFLAAEPLTLIATFGLSLAYALYRRGTLRPLWSRANLRWVAGFFLVGILMVALCAVQFLPAVDFLSQSRRGTQGLRYGETSKWSFHPLSLLEVVEPDFFGPPFASGTGWSAVVGDGNTPYFPVVFVGFIPLFFALTGWGLGQGPRRVFVAAAALILLFVSFGHLTPVFSLAYLLIPLLIMVRFPVKLIVLVVFLTAILAGWGLDALREQNGDWKARRNRILIPLKCLLTCEAAVWLISWMQPKLIAVFTRWVVPDNTYEAAELRQMAEFLLAALRIHSIDFIGFTLAGLLIVLGLEKGRTLARRSVPIIAFLGLVQLLVANYEANPTVPKMFFTFRPAVLSQFKAPSGSYRISSPVFDVFTAAGANDLQSFVSFQSLFKSLQLSPIALGAVQQRLMLATGSMLNKVEGGISLDIERSMPPYLYDVWIYMRRQAPDALHVDCLLGRTNVKYIIRRVRTDSSVTRMLGEVFNGSPQPSYLFEDLCFVPRAYVAGTAVFATNSLDTLRRLASPDFDAGDAVVLAAEPAKVPEFQASSPPGQVEIVERQPNNVTLRAELSRPGYVVLMERYDPNWHASVDGVEVPVLRANQLFRAVYVGPGKHQIRFFYRERWLKLGLIISLSTLALLALLYWRNVKVPAV